MNDNLRPKIYVACLAAYNNSYLHGCWINADRDINDIHNEIESMLANSPVENAEEWAIHDFDCFGDISLDEYESLDTVNSLAQLIVEHDLVAGKLFEYYGNNIDEVERTLEENYHGAWDSKMDFAESLFNDCYSNEIPENILFYIDYQKFSDDLFIDDYFSINVNHEIHVFSYY